MWICIILISQEKKTKYHCETKILLGSKKIVLHPYLINLLRHHYH